jgi:branched-chain amino acid aminotransferase
MSGRTVYFNGEYVQESEARVSIFDSASMFGDMAFEMTRTFQGKPFRLRHHLDRLYGSLRLLEIESGISLEEMEELTHQTLERNIPTEAGDVDWLIMHNVSRGPLSLYRTVFPQGVRPTVSINCWPLITHMGQFAPNYDPGVDLVIVPQQAVPAHIVDPKAKTRSRLHYQLAQLQGARMGADKWPVLLDPDGFLAEGPGWNLLLVKDGVLISPEGRNILLGVSRGATLDVARELGIPTREANLGRYEALQADEILCTATTYSLVHARSFEGQLVGDGRPGMVFQQLMQGWKRLAGVDFVSQAHEYARRLPDWEKKELEPLRNALI